VLLRRMPIFRGNFAATQCTVFGSHIWELEVKEHRKPHVLSIYQIVIRSELKYSIRAKNLSLPKWGSAE
jgi:hypothetical protein